MSYSLFKDTYLSRFELFFTNLPASETVQKHVFVNESEEKVNHIETFVSWHS